MADAEGTFQGEPTYSAHAHNERALFRGTGLGLTDKELARHMGSSFP